LGKVIWNVYTTLGHAIIRLPGYGVPKAAAAQGNSGRPRAALVNAAAERLHRWRIVAGNDEAVGIVENVWVAVGGGGVDNDLSQLICRGARHCDTETLLHRGPR